MEVNNQKVFDLVAAGHLTPEEGALLSMAEKYKTEFERSNLLNIVLMSCLAVIYLAWVVCQ